MIQAEIRIDGVVQGVGFRPFAYNLAHEFSIKGYILNDGNGVFIVACGGKEQVDMFIDALKSRTPINAKIDALTIKTSDEIDNFHSFEIRNSTVSGTISATMPPDISTCHECLREMNDPKNRRYLYPFITCTNCGPRYTMIKRLPYDRENTSMARFSMCPECQKEYDDPSSRRFHSESNSCPKCGPKISLHRASGELLASGDKAIEVFAKLIKKGSIIAVKGIGGFHLACDATKNFVISELRARKNRPTKPFAVMFRSIIDIAKCTELTNSEESLLLSPLRPIVLISKHRPHRLQKFAISCDGVAPNVGTMGVFLPYSPLHSLIMEQLRIPLVFTSANISGEPLVRDSRELLEKLEGIFDYYLDHDREITNPCDDSVVTLQGSSMQIVRRARGFAPSMIALPFTPQRRILALGAQQKSTLAIAVEKGAILSPHIGDLDNPATLAYYHRIRKILAKTYDFAPEIVVADKHPNYETSHFADTLERGEVDFYTADFHGLDSKETKAPRIVRVQHHYAHLLSLLVEKKISQKVLGIIWDGTGYGDDGNIWGGEFLLGDMHGYERVGHFKNFRLLGGEGAIKEPKKLALSLLFGIYGKDALNLRHPILSEFSHDELEILYKMYENGLNAPLCSSVGRLFDAVASMCGIVKNVSFEGECGMALEGLYNQTCEELYSYKIERGVVDIDEMICEILGSKESHSMVASKFINTLAQIALDMAKLQNLPVALSGGVFQNRELCARIATLFKREGIKLYMHEQIPCNDGGIAIGQLAYAHFWC